VVMMVVRWWILISYIFSIIQIAKFVAKSITMSLTVYTGSGRGLGTSDAFNQTKLP
jgi:hypothetical protein